MRKGDEYRCVTIVQNGKLKLLAPVLRRSYRDTVFLGVLRYADDHLDRLQAYIQRFLADSGIQNSIIKADIIVSEKSIDMIEMDIGVGGGTYYKTFVSRLYDRNLMDEYIRLITGDKVTPFRLLDPICVWTMYLTIRAVRWSMIWRNARRCCQQSLVNARFR